MLVAAVFVHGFFGRYDVSGVREGNVVPDLCVSAENRAGNSGVVFAECAVSALRACLRAVCGGSDSCICVSSGVNKYVPENGS